MYNRHLKYAKLIWYFVFSISVLLNPTHTGRSPCEENFKKSGNYSLLKEECEVYYINLDFKNTTSIIDLTVSIQYLGDSAISAEDKIDSGANFIIAVHEPTEYTGKTEKVLLQEWNETTSIERNYLSRSSKVFISVSGTGDWSYYNITFSFHEIEYSLIPVNDLNTFAMVEYRPNSVSLLRLQENSKRKGIEISVHNLNISTEMGEYLLIGTGTEPLRGKASESLYVMQVTSNSKFYVESSTAFVAFVSGSIRKLDKHFKIEWDYIDGNSIPDTTEDPLGNLNSSLICFYNIPEAKQEFLKSEDITYERFRQRFAEVAASHLQGEYENKNLDKRSVKLFGEPTEKKNSSGETVALGVLIKVVHKGKSVFTWRDLQNIIQQFEEHDKAALFGYKIGKCPQESELPYKDKLRFVIYALVPVFGLFGLLMWAWKHNLFSQKCKPEKEETLSFGHTPAEPNPYVQAIPRVYATNDHGRRETLIQGTSQEEERVAEETTMVEMVENATSSTSQEPDTLTRFLNSRRSKPRPSLKSLIDQTEEHNELSHVGKTEVNGSEHLYDSVSSSKQLDETKL